MRPNIFAAFILAAGALSVGTSQAADATHPYSNVNHAVDAGNNTGDSQTDQLNQQQLRKTQNGAYAQWQAGQRYGGPAYGYRPPYAYAYPYPYAPYPHPYYAPAFYRPYVGFGWGWGWRHRYWR